MAAAAAVTGRLADVRELVAAMKKLHDRDRWPRHSVRAANVDTDMIIPASHLKTLRRAGLGRYAFDAMRAEAGQCVRRSRLCRARRS